MSLSTLILRDFRNLGDQTLEFPADGVALVGANAQGKSNLLEAIYYLESFRSFRLAKDDQMVAFGAELFRIEGSIPREGCETVLAAAYRRRDRHKRVVVDGVARARLGEAVGHLGAVVFSPHDVHLVTGSPSGRRRFLDMVLSLNRPGYMHAAQGYRRVLAQRNAALRDGQSDRAVIAWNDALVANGAKVVAERLAWIESSADAFASYHRDVSGGEEAVMRYRPSTPLNGASSLEEITDAFNAALVGSAESERRRAATQVGPHRDDFNLCLSRGGDRGEVDLHRYGSGGQCRTASLALRLVEARTVREARSRLPILLLDDIFAELDLERSECVLAVLEAEKIGQVLLTAPKDADVRVRRDSLTRWSIDGGRVST